MEFSNFIFCYDKQNVSLGALSLVLNENSQNCKNKLLVCAATNFPDEFFCSQRWQCESNVQRLDTDWLSRCWPAEYVIFDLNSSTWPWFSQRQRAFQLKRSSHLTIRIRAGNFYRLIEWRRRRRNKRTTINFFNLLNLLKQPMLMIHQRLFVVLNCQIFFFLPFIF